MGAMSPLNSPLIVTMIVACLATPAIVPVLAQNEPLGNGFFHHGVATPISSARGIVSAVGGDDQPVVLVWLLDHRGAYGILMIDAATGGSQTIATPFPTAGDSPFASILSRDNKYYTHFNGHFCEFDPVRGAFTFHQKTKPRVAMSMTEDDRGVIWAATYPGTGLVSFDPATREVVDYGYINTENWAQYPRDVAADDAGWLYVGIGNTASQLIAFHPQSREIRPMIPETERARGRATATRALDGKVYGKASPAVADNWYVMQQGQATRLGGKPAFTPKPIIAGDQGLVHRALADGSQLVECNLVERQLVVRGSDGEHRAVAIDYESDGAHIMGLATASDGTICGGTAFPMRFFSYDPRTTQWINREAYGQWNTVAPQGNRFFVGGYGGGYLLEWDPAREWVNTAKGNAESNPRFLFESRPTINRPHDLLAHSDGRTVILAGTPGYGFTGGGLLFWDRQESSAVILEHTDILPQLSTMSLVELSDRKLLGGTTTSPGTGGEKLANEAELYIMDLDTRQVQWHEPIFPGVQSYTDLCVDPTTGLVYGFADRARFFVFDAKARKAVHDRHTEPDLGQSNFQQGPRTFVTDPDGRVFVLFTKGIAQIDPATFALTMLAESPVPIGPGGDWLDGRIYFGSGSHLYSYQVNPDASR